LSNVGIFLSIFLFQKYFCSIQLILTLFPSLLGKFLENSHITQFITQFYCSYNKHWSVYSITFQDNLWRSDIPLHIVVEFHWQLAWVVWIMKTFINPSYILWICKKQEGQHLMLFNATFNNNIGYTISTINIFYCWFVLTFPVVYSNINHNTFPLVYPNISHLAFPIIHLNINQLTFPVVYSNIDHNTFPLVYPWINKWECFVVYVWINNWECLVVYAWMDTWECQLVYIWMNNWECQGVMFG
jgi:hypothetical protein